MKLLFLMATCLCLITIEVKGQTKTTYDKFEDRTLTHTPSRAISTEMGYAHELSVVGYFYFRGKGAGRPIEAMGLMFISRAREWKFLKDEEMIAIVDGRRLPIGKPTTKDTDIPTTTSSYEEQRVEETLEFRLSYSVLRKLADAKRVEVRLGHIDFPLPFDFQADLRNLLTKVKTLPPARKKN